MTDSQKQHNNIIERVGYIEAKEKSLDRRIVSAEEKLNTKVLSEILLKLKTTEDGIIINNSANILLLSQIGKIYDSISEKELAEIVGFLKTSLQHLVRMNEIYFEIAIEKKLVKPQAAIVKSQIDTFLGIRKSGRLQKGGILSIIKEDKSIASKIKKQLFSEIMSGGTLKDVQEKLTETIKGSGKSGIIKKMISVGTDDLYSNIDRVASTNIAERIGLTAFIYTGTKITTSRPFCSGGKDNYAGTFSKKIGEVFLDSEAQSWNNIRKFEGKGKGYNASINLGHINCRHHKGYIDDFTAMELRKDLKIVDGVLTTDTPRFKKW